MFIQGELGDPGSRKEVLWEKLKGKELRSEKNVLGSFLLWNIYTRWLTPLHQHHFTGEKTEAQGGGVIVSGRTGRIGPESCMMPPGRLYQLMEKRERRGHATCLLKAHPCHSCPVIHQRGPSPLLWALPAPSVIPAACLPTSSQCHSARVSDVHPPAVGMLCGRDGWLTPESEGLKSQCLNLKISCPPK